MTCISWRFNIGFTPIIKVHSNSDVHICVPNYIHYTVFIFNYIFYSTGKSLLINALIIT